MLKKNFIVSNIIQIYSLIIKDLKLKSRYKLEFIVEFVAPFMTIFFPYITFTTLFALNENAFGNYFSRDNFVLFLLLGYCVSVLVFLLWNYQDLFYDEKTWKTLNAVIVAPISKFNILVSYLISGLISKSVPLIFIVVLCYILYPIPLISLLFVVVILFCISLVFASMGFILGVFTIVNEDISTSLSVGISFIALVSCLFYPIDIFPKEIHFFIKLNPLYYYFDLLRLSWWAGIDYDDAMNYITFNHILVVTTFKIIMPIIASYLFLIIYKKYGTSGY